MKMLCITGVSEPDLIQIEECFCQAGMAAPLSIERNGKQLNMRQWHDRFCDDALMAEEMPSIGKFGEQVASEIFFSNMDSFWGWADNRSAHLLDFWADFDPNLVFLLTACPLDYHLARLMETEDAASLNLEDLIRSWHYTHEHLLRFYHTHQERCLLVDVHDCITQFSALSKACQDKWNLSLENLPEPQLKEYPFPASLARHIAANFLDSSPEVTSLWNELEATASKFTSDTNRPNDISFNEIAQSYQTLKDRSHENQQIFDLKKEINALQQQHKETEAENDLILRQLHQVQEELESIFLQKQDAEQQWAEQQKKLQNHSKEKEEQLNALQQQHKEQLDQTIKDRNNKAGQIQSLTQERDNLSQEKNNLAQQLDQQKKLAEQRLEKISALEPLEGKLNEKENQLRTVEKEQREKQEQFQTKLKNQEQQLNALQQQHKEIEKENERQLQSLKEEHKKIRHENEQWLYQLHEVQEELGGYLIKYQEQNKALEKADARWERLLERMPDYCDYGRITVMEDDASNLIWEVQDLEVGSQTYPELKFETFLVGGVAGFRFKHPDHITQGDLIPVAQTSEEAKKQSSIFKSLSTTEWLLLESTAYFLKTCLKTETFDEETLPANLIQETVSGLNRFIEVITKFPQTFRFDQIHMDEKEISEDCEYLEISLENLSCGEIASPKFVFRLSCAGLESSDFGSNPRLEFPEETGTILKNWFDSSKNPDDPRLELRFALPEAMDLEVWNQLSKEDAGFISMLTEHLPVMIEKKAVQSGNDDTKWLAVAQSVEQILKRRIQVQKGQVV